MRYFLVFILLFPDLTIRAQQVLLRGTLRDLAGTSLPGAVIKLTSVADTNHTGGTLTDTYGQFYLNLPPDSYVFRASLLGYRELLFNLEVRSGYPVRLDSLTLEEQTLYLKEAVVRGTATGIRFEAGKTVISPKASLMTAQGDLLAVLKSTPGVFATEEGIIRLNGQSGVNIRINGKEIFLSGASLAAFLKSITIESVEEIELISLPSAEYEAAGKAGIINIRLKKSSQQGSSLTMSTSFQKSKNSRGDWSGRGTIGRQKFGFSIDYSGANSTRQKQGSLNRQIREEMLFAQQLISLTNRDTRHSFKVISDVNFSNNISANVYMGRNFYRRIIPGSATTRFFREESAIDSLLHTTTYSRYQQNTYTTGGQIHFRGQKKQDLTLSADYLSFNHDESLMMNNETQLSPSTSRIEKRSGHFRDDVNALSLYSDFGMPINDKLKLKTGIKQSKVAVRNKAFHLPSPQTIDQLPLPGSMQYLYKESIASGYTQLSAQFKKVSSHLGLRAELTTIDGGLTDISNSTDSIYHLQFLRLFPTLSIQYRTKGTAQLNLGYSRRISRPNYRDLSPSGYIVDPYVMVTGNVTLKPELTNHFEFSYLPTDSFRNSINLTTTRHGIAQSFQRRENGGILIYPENFFQQWILGVKSDISSLRLTHRWTLGGSISAIYSVNKWQKSNQPVIRRIVSPMLNVSSSFRLGRGWNGELTSYYYGALISGQIRIHPTGSLSVGLRKKWLDGKLSLSLQANDILATIRERNIFQTDFISGDTNLRYEETFVGFSVFYLIKKGKQKELRNADFEGSKRINF